MVYQCENNYLDNDKNLILRETLRKKDFPWYIEDKLYFKHTFITDSKMVSNFCYLLKPFTEKIKNEVLQASGHLVLQNNKMNKMRLNNEKIQENFLCLLHFINSSTGSIEINNMDQIPYNVNRAVLFDNNIKTTHNTPTKHNQFFIEILFKN
tara:strand:- start:2769 stop:3224 length:456 start_codon:yes stop_codon:yes gene_type:complete